MRSSIVDPVGDAVTISPPLIEIFIAEDEFFSDTVTVENSSALELEYVLEAESGSDLVTAVLFDDTELI